LVGSTARVSLCGRTETHSVYVRAWMEVNGLFFLLFRVRHRSKLCACFLSEEAGPARGDYGIRIQFVDERNGGGESSAV